MLDLTLTAFTGGNMIEWDRVTQRYTVQTRENFTSNTRQDVRKFQQSISHNPVLALMRVASPQDRLVADLGVSASGTPSGKNLDHHIAISAIDKMIVDYLNDDEDKLKWVFLNFVGHIVTPSWLSLSHSVLQQDGRVLSEWATATIGKFTLLMKRYREKPDELVVRANALSDLLNSAQQNLRFGDATTNKSINNDLDARLARGLRLDFFGLVEMAWSAATGRPVLSAETSSFLSAGYSTLGDSAQLSLRDPKSKVGVVQKWVGGVAMSESGQQIATTTSDPFNPVMGERNPAVSALRGNIPGLTYSPVGRDTMVYLFAIIVLILLVTDVSVPLWRS